jgi:hypothetical protein
MSDALNERTCIENKTLEVIERYEQRRRNVRLAHWFIGGIAFGILFGLLLWA